jgi:hypothetical protein
MSDFCKALAKADDPVIAGREEMHGFGLETHLHVLLDARFSGCVKS